ncbi:hypothetical protein RSK20926_21699 [Roseobacter sp. SK209-2-6]|uniref:hypothetical protein n=1 Tax=Roseobacter sp. SK209-2-6 TaxID=388739 RepID=UPI0000F3F241|nr:hypothetical protein [Roseobacter sp. SK209-2-6]EBA16383.1 hypothetical protein RSK20926_21699 [Roseobacter sp. SK209-2-6]
MLSDREIIARDAWGEVLPDWIAALVSECDSASQNAVAANLGMSATVVSQAIRNCYPGNLAGIENAVRDVFMNAPVQCPALRKKVESAACRNFRKQAENWTQAAPSGCV